MKKKFFVISAIVFLVSFSSFATVASSTLYEPLPGGSHKFCFGKITNVNYNEDKNAIELTIGGSTVLVGVGPSENVESSIAFWESVQYNGWLVFAECIGEWAINIDIYPIYAPAELLNYAT